MLDIYIQRQCPFERGLPGMASRGIDDEDTSISVLSDPSASQSCEAGSGADQIPEFHMYTGSYESDASHYALSLSHRALQKKNRDLEQQVQRLQREKSKIHKSRGRKGSSAATGSGSEESLSPKMYRSRSVVQDAPPSGETYAMDDFIVHLQRQLEKLEQEKIDAVAQLEETQIRCQNCEQRRRQISQELDQALEIAASRLEELETARQDNEYQRAKVEKLQAVTGTTETLQRRLKEAEATAAQAQREIAQAQREHASMQQLYEESASKEDALQQSLDKCQTTIRDLTSKVSDRDNVIDRQKKAIMDFHIERKRQEEVNEMLRAELDKKHQGTSQNSTSEDENDSLLEETREVILELQSRILAMHEVIRKQNGLIQDLVWRVQQRSQGSLTSHERSSASPGAMALDRPVTLAMSPLPSPCDEEEEPRTMVGTEGEMDNETSLLRVHLPQPSQTVRPRIPTSSDANNRLSGVVINGDQQPTLPTFNFSSQAVIGGSRSNGTHTEPIVRHPPPVSTQRPVTAPFSTRQNAMVTTETNFITTETNCVMDNFGGERSNLYTKSRTRVPVEQSDHVTDTSSSASPKECPICNRHFPQLSQEAFELHVNHCLTKAESSPTAIEPPAPPVGGDILECPVCNQIYAPGTPQSEFQNHVDSHFVEENFEFLSQQQRH